MQYATCTGMLLPGHLAATGVYFRSMCIYTVHIYPSQSIEKTYMYYNYRTWIGTKKAWAQCHAYNNKCKDHTKSSLYKLTTHRKATLCEATVYTLYWYIWTVVARRQCMICGIPFLFIYTVCTSCETIYIHNVAESFPSCYGQGG